MKTLQLTLILLFSTSISFAQTVRTVGFGGQYATFQDAIDASVSGDIIHLHPITSSYGTVTIDKELHIIGLGHNPADHNENIVATVATINLTADADNTSISGIKVGTIQANNVSGIDDIRVSNCNISSTIRASNSTGTGWLVEGCYFTYASANIYYTDSITDFTLKNNFFRGYLDHLDDANVVYNCVFINSSATFYTFRYCTNLAVANSIFIGTHASYDGVDVISSTIDGSHNLTYNSTGTTIAVLFGADNLDNTNPEFTTINAGDYYDFYNNDYSLQATSAGHNYGVDGTDIGIYGNAYPFDPNGWPWEIPRPTALDVTTPVISFGAGQSLEFNFSAKQRD